MFDPFIYFVKEKEVRRKNTSPLSFISCDAPRVCHAILLSCAAQVYSERERFCIAPVTQRQMCGGSERKSKRKRAECSVVGPFFLALLLDKVLKTKEQKFYTFSCLSDWGIALGNQDSRGRPMGIDLELKRCGLA